MGHHHFGDEPFPVGAKPEDHLVEARPWALTSQKPGPQGEKSPRLQAKATPTARRGEMGHPVEESLVP
ncbi:hypothetical protein TJA_24540 [Thermus sp. LT1-2-5]